MAFEITSGAQENGDKPINGVFITVPAMIGERAGDPLKNLRVVEYDKGNGQKQREAVVKLPAGTLIGDKDVSFYEFLVPADRVSPANGTYNHTHMIFQAPDKDGVMHDIKLRRNFEKKTDDDVWVSAYDEVWVSAAELRDACRKQIENQKTSRAYQTAEDKTWLQEGQMTYAQRKDDEPKASFGELKKEATNRSAQGVPNRAAEVVRGVRER